MPKKSQLESCNGKGCPMKDTCVRFKADINEKKDLHLAWAPYDDIKDKCTFFIKKDIKPTV